MSPTDNGNLVKAGQNHLSSTMASKKSTLASVGRHSTKAGEEKTVGINLIFLQSGTANKLLELMKEGKLLEEEVEEMGEGKGEVKSRQTGKTRISPKTAMSMGISQEDEDEGDSDCSEVNFFIANFIIAKFIIAFRILYDLG